MKKTITCLAMIASASAFAAGKTETKTEKRDPASQGPYAGATFVGCQPRAGFYTGSDAYKNNCVAEVSMIDVPQGGMAPPGSTTKVAACDKNHFMVVSSYPIRFVCMPPGAMEL